MTVTLFKAEKRGFAARVEFSNGAVGVYDTVIGQSRQFWREYARSCGYGHGRGGGCKLREVRYVSAYPRHQHLIAALDGCTA